nr:hypothetical protein A6C57_23380 [Fibrella sp. ES10-3-2-2]
MYNDGGMSANSVKSTAQRQGERPGTVSSIELTLGIMDNVFRDSSAMIVCRALSAYRETLSKALAKYIQDGAFADAGGTLAMMRDTDEILEGITFDIQYAAQQNKRVAEYRLNPAYYKTDLEREAIAADEYEAAIESIVY